MQKTARLCNALLVAVGFFWFAVPVVNAGYPVGTIVKVDGRPNLYMMVPVGKAAHIPTVKIIQCLGIENRKPVHITKDELKAMPTSPLLLSSPAGAIYRIDGDKKRHISSPAEFQRRGYDPASVLPMTDQQLNCIPDGPKL